MIDLDKLLVASPPVSQSRSCKRSDTLGSWRVFGCRDDANAWRKSAKEADKHKKFLMQFRK